MIASASREPSGLPAPVLARRRAEARAILTDPASTQRLRRLAWRFLKTWGASRARTECRP